MAWKKYDRKNGKCQVSGYNNRIELNQNSKKEIYLIGEEISPEVCGNTTTTITTALTVICVIVIIIVITK